LEYRLVFGIPGSIAPAVQFEEFLNFKGIDKYAPVLEGKSVLISPEVKGVRGGYKVIVQSRR
jgi:hypothetical protein